MLIFHANQLVQSPEKTPDAYEQYVNDPLFHRVIDGLIQMETVGHRGEDVTDVLRRILMAVCAERQRLVTNLEEIVKRGLPPIIIKL